MPVAILGTDGTAVHPMKGTRAGRNPAPLGWDFGSHLVVGDVPVGYTHRVATD